MSAHFTGSYWLLVISRGVGAPPRLARASDGSNSRPQRIRPKAPANDQRRTAKRSLTAVSADQPPVRIARGHVAGERPDIGDIGDRFRTAVDDRALLVARH